MNDELFFYSECVMKREEIAKKLARETGLSKSAARNEVDQLVAGILRKLRQGQKVKLPGVGKLVGKKPGSGSGSHYQKPT